VPEAAARFEIFVPGLFTPQPALRALPAAERPDLGDLETALARADVFRAAPDSVGGMLARLFGWPEGPLPLATLSARQDGLGGESGVWLRADPVCLLPDRDCLRLVDARPRLSADEAAALVAAIRDYLAAEGWHIAAPHPGRWYLHGEGEIPAAGSPLPEVAGEDIAAHLPAAGPWRQRLNGIQMCLHDHPVNREREARGLLPINSVWFWGAGRWVPPPAPRWQRIFTDDPLLAAVAAGFGMAHHPLEALGTSAAPGKVLVLDTRLWPADVRRDPLAWLAGVARFNDEILRVLTRRMNEEKFAMRLHDEHGRRFHLSPRQRWRLWRRARPIETLGRP